MERDLQGLEDEAVLMSVQTDLTCGIIRDVNRIVMQERK